MFGQHTGHFESVHVHAQLVDMCISSVLELLSLGFLGFWQFFFNPKGTNVGCEDGMLG